MHDTLQRATAAYIETLENSNLVLQEQIAQRDKVIEKNDSRSKADSAGPLASPALRGRIRCAVIALDTMDNDGQEELRAGRVASIRELLEELAAMGELSDADDAPKAIRAV